MRVVGAGNDDQIDRLVGRDGQGVGPYCGAGHRGGHVGRAAVRESQTMESTSAARSSTQRRTNRSNQRQPARAGFTTARYTK